MPGTERSAVLTCFSHMLHIMPSTETTAVFCGPAAVFCEASDPSAPCSVETAGTGHAPGLPFTAFSATITFADSVSGSALFLIGWSCFALWTLKRLRRSAFMQTVKLDRDIAAAPHIGFI